MKTIIIIDQNLGLLEILCHALKIKDYEAFGYSGHELDLYGLIQKLSPSLIIIDLSFPLDEAIRWCSRIKTLYPHLAIAAMSCNQQVFTKINPQFLTTLLTNLSTSIPCLNWLKSMLRQPIETLVIASILSAK